MHHQLLGNITEIEGICLRVIVPALKKKGESKTCIFMVSFHIPGRFYYESRAAPAIGLVRRQTKHFTCKTKSDD
jgi:hypothetical protein